MREHSYIIAEAGVNHNGDKELAYALIDAAAAAGADAVKFQTFQAERLTSATIAQAEYQKINRTAPEESQRSMLKQLELPYAWHAELKGHATGKGIDFLSTAFDVPSLAFLETLDMPRYKIPSGEVTNGPFLWRYAKLGKPLILSTGMCDLREVEVALAVLWHGMHHTAEPKDEAEVLQYWKTAPHGAMAQQVTLLHCTSHYPAPDEQIHLRAMATLAERFGLPVGYSDHTAGIAVSVAAVALGACVIEKHLTTDRNLPGPDHQASIEPEMFRQMVQQIRQVERALGAAAKTRQPCEENTVISARQQVVAARVIAAGALLCRDDLTTARAGGGHAPNDLWGMVGTKARRSYAAGDVIE